MKILRQSTAGQEIPIGYLVDSTDGDTEETGLTINAADILLHKTGASSVVAKNSGGATHDQNGIYIATLDATDTDTLGPLTVHVHVSGSLAFRDCYTVVTSAMYDILMGTTLVAREGADSDTLETLSDQIDGIASGANVWELVFT